MNPARRERCRLLLALLSAQQGAEAFCTPADELRHPGYAAAVKQPMDFGTVGRRLAAREYESPACFAEHVRLTLRNYLNLHHPRSAIARAATRAGATLERLLQYWSLATEQVRGPCNIRREGRAIPCNVRRSLVILEGREGIPL